MYKAGGDDDDENCTQKSLLIGCHIVFYVQIFIFLAHSYGDDMSLLLCIRKCIHLDLVESSV
jgi:hypothetical protein